MMKVCALDLMPIICSALKRGQCVRMTVTGGSMRPFMQGGGIVELEPIGSKPLVGDVLLVRTGSGRDRYVLHRLVRVEGENLFIRGDAQERCEGPFARPEVLGRVVMYRLNGRIRRFDSGLWHLLGRAWIACFPLSVWLLRIAVTIRGAQ
ncbi:MAG: S26 family signal peptidase [Syntrophobacteraceae bacterium]|nr:S26 family signal peptidase [Syntrophobacteraceae bacterium]